MLEVIRVTTLLLYCYQIGYGMTICEKRASYKEALSCCESSGSTLPVIQTLEDNLMLNRLLTEKNKTSTWLAIKRIYFQTFMWLDGSKQDGEKLDDRGGCAIHDLSLTRLKTTPCGSRNHGHICEKSDCDSCFSTGIRRHECQQAGAHCYTLHCEGKNWFKAAEDCRSWNATLYIRNEKLNITPSSKTCVDFWIGLRRVDWEWNHGLYIGSGGMSFWGDNEPKTTGGCAVFRVFQQGFEWLSVDCNSKQHFVCSKSFVASTHRNDSNRYRNISVTETITTILDGKKPQLALMLCLSIGTAILLLIIVGYALWRKCLRNQSGPRGMITEEETIHLNQPEGTSCHPDVEEALQIVKFNRITKHFSLDLRNLKRVLTKQESNDPGSPLVVLSITGPFRMGKSFLLNFIVRYLRELEKGSVDYWLQDQEQELSGFPWKAGAEVATLGLWMWSRPFQITYKSGRRISVLLIDSQGIFDAPNQSEAATMVTLSCLMSSMQIYNVMETFSIEDLNQLEVTFKSSQLLRELANESTIGPFIKRFILLIRDKMITPESPGYSKGGNMFLETIIKNVKDDGISEEDQRKYAAMFAGVETIDCFLMPSPGKLAEARYAELFTGKLKDIDTEFQKGLEEFTKYLFEEKRIEILQCSGLSLNGIQLLQRFMKFTSYFNIEDMAKPEYTAKVLIEDMNTLQLRKAMKLFYSHIPQVLEEKRETNFLKYMETYGQMLYQRHETGFVGSKEEREKCKDTLKEILNLTATEDETETISGEEIFIEKIRTDYLKSMESAITEGKQRDELEELHQRVSCKILNSLPEKSRTEPKKELMNSLFEVLRKTVG